MAKEMQDVNESRFNPARATAASAPAVRILVVEDEAALSMFLSYNLEAESFTVDRAILLENEPANDNRKRVHLTPPTASHARIPKHRPIDRLQSQRIRCLNRMPTFSQVPMQPSASGVVYNRQPHCEKR